MACWTSWNTKANSRPRLRALVLWEIIAPGGKCARRLDYLFGQQRDEELPIEPCLRALLIMLGEMAQLRDLFQTLEHQFHLPAQSVGFQDPLGAIRGAGKSAQHHHVL